jgi:hypothetical protein
MPAPRTRAALACAFLIGALFFAFAGDGLRSYFTPDDMMNLYFAWSAPILHADRPVGALVYRGLFALFGLHPLPYRVLAYALLLANLGLLYLFCARVSHSREAAALACLLGAYHAHLSDLYYSTGTIYDLLCFFFLFLAFTYYLEIRDSGAFPSWPQTAALTGLLLLAMGSKEMAVSLPVLLVVYETIYHRAKGWTRWRFIWIGGGMTALFLIYKTTGARRMTGNPDYALTFSIHAIMAACKRYLDDLSYGAVRFNSVKIVFVLVLMLVFAALVRRRELLFAWCFVLLAASPILFIPPRALFAAYVTLPGWYLYGATLLMMCRDTIMLQFARVAASLHVKPEQASLFLVVGLLLIPLHRIEKPLGNGWVPWSHGTVRTVISGLSRYPEMPRGARVLFLDDPFPKDEWMLTFMFRLFYKDDQMRIDRAQVWPRQAEEPARSEYQRFFVLDNQGLREVGRNP